MIIKLISFLFSKLIGNLSPEQKKDLETKFMAVMSEAIKAGVAGAKR
jgi:hypothetical protein